MIMIINTKVMLCYQASTREMRARACTTASYFTIAIAPALTADQSMFVQIHTYLRRTYISNYKLRTARFARSIIG